MLELTPGAYTLLHPKNFTTALLYREVYSDVKCCFHHQDLLKIGRAHRFCLKKIQGMFELTRTDVALSMLQMTDMLAI